MKDGGREATVEEVDYSLATMYLKSNSNVTTCSQVESVHFSKVLYINTFRTRNMLFLRKLPRVKTILG
jgi:hypothetical protein